MDGIFWNILVLLSNGLIVQLFNGARASAVVSEVQSENIWLISVTLEVSQLVAPSMLMREVARLNM